MSRGQDLLELFVAPGSAALLPWRLAAAWLRRLAACEALYREETLAARAQAARAPGSAVDQSWVRRFRFVKLVDHADLYFSLTRGDAWLDTCVEVRGRWPARGPFIAFTFHWGTGFWSLRHLRRAGHRPAMLSTPIGASPLPDDWRGRYAHLRNRAVERACGEPVIYLGGAKARIREHLTGGGVLVGLLDVPRCQTPESLPVTVRGRETSLPRGLFALAMELGLPMVPFVFRLNAETGQRQLDIKTALAAGSEEALAQQAASLFEGLLAEDSAAWHRWPDADLFFPSNAP